MQWVINRSTTGLGATFVAWVLLVAVIVIGHMPADAETSPPRSRGADAVMGHVNELQRIADSNGGHREAGSAGHRESVEYFESVLRDAGLKVWTEPFEFLYTRSDRAELTVEGENLDLVPAAFGPSTNGTLRAPTYFLESEGCSEKEYLNVPRGSVVILDEPSGCTITEQHRFASESGAAAALVVSTTDVPPYIWLNGAGLRDIPTAGISRRTAETIRVKQPLVSLTLEMVTERRSSVNLIAESPGFGGRVIELGAHLDSVPQGPGINDNAVSAAVLLEQAISSAQSDHEKTHRYMFWSAEEFAFAGSRSYLRNVDNPERVSAYINLEMLAAPNSGYFYARNDGSVQSRVIEDAIVEGYSQRGIQPARDTNEIPRSDDSSYQEAGIPTGGIWGGSFEMKTPEQAEIWGGSANEPFDSCYHRACDTAERIDPQKADHALNVVNHVLLTMDDVP